MTRDRKRHLHSLRSGAPGPACGLPPRYAITDERARVTCLRCVRTKAEAGPTVDTLPLLAWTERGGVDVMSTRRFVRIQERTPTPSSIKATREIPPDFGVNVSDETGALNITITLHEGKIRIQSDGDISFDPLARHVIEIVPRVG